MTYDASDRKDVRRAEKASRRADRENRDVVVELCSTAPGRAWVWERLSSAHIFTPCFTPDPYTTAFNEGQRNQGLQLLAQVTAHCPEQFVQMMRESNDRSRPDPRDDADDAGDPSGINAYGRAIEPDLFDEPAGTG